MISLRSADFAEAASVPLGSIQPLEGAGRWANYPLGVVSCLAGEGFELGGFTAEISSDLPPGAGLSSSAALEVATGMLLAKLFRLDIAPLQMARLCRKGENEFTGVPCGLLDQVSSAMGRKDHALFLDCRHETVEAIPVPKGVVLLVADSGIKHAHSGGEYTVRRAECLEAARRLGLPALRDISMTELRAAKQSLPELLFRRAAHIVGENERVSKGAGLLRAGDAAGFGELMFASHESSRVNFENSTEPLDALVKIARGIPGVFGSRLTGGGFGGATVSLVRKEEAEAIRSRIAREYRDRTGNTGPIYLCEFSDGAR